MKTLMLMALACASLFVAGCAEDEYVTHRTVYYSHPHYYYREYRPYYRERFYVEPGYRTYWY
jgi:hypothetical protein